MRQNAAASGWDEGRKNFVGRESACDLVTRHLVLNDCCVAMAFDDDVGGGFREGFQVKSLDGDGFNGWDERR